MGLRAWEHGGWCVATTGRVLFLLSACTPTRTPVSTTTGVPATDTQTVQVHEGTELVAQLSPDGRKIAILLMGLPFIVDRHGGIAEPLSDPSKNWDRYWYVAWAPDSRRVALTRSTELSVIDVVTRTAQVVSRRGDLRNPVWAPDGRAIVVAITAGDSAGLWAYPSDGRGSATRLGALLANQDPDAWFADYVAYSPDRKFLALADPLRELNLDTWRVRLLTDSATRDMHPAYSPDGRWIAFLSERSGSRQLWLIPRGGGTARALTRDVEDAYDEPLSWTPDSRAVLYTAAGRMRLAALDGGPEATIPFTVEFKLERFGGLRRPQIPEPGSREVARGIVRPELSPDGARVAFSALGDLWMAGVSDREPRRLTHTPWIDEAGVSWSPDGARLAYAATPYGRPRELRVLELDGARRDHAVTGIPVDDVHGDRRWSPDGRRLAYPARGGVGWVDLESGATHQIAAPAGASAVTIAGWTSRGDSIVFSVNEARTDTLAPLYPGTRNVPALLRASALDSGLAERWKVPGEYAVQAGWTSDLTRAAYVAAGIGYYVRVGGPSRPVRIADPVPRFFSWSADGNRLLFLSGSAIRLLDVATGAARTLPITPEFQVASAPTPLLVTNVRIIDGSGAPPTSPRDVLVAGGRIRAIAAPGRLQAPAGTRIVDGAGRTMLPGLFDMHQHLPNQPPGPVFVYHGILAVRDVGMTAESAQAYRELAESGEMLSPRVFLSGGFFHPDRGGNSGTSVRAVNESDPLAIADEVRSLVAMGAGILKIRTGDAPFEALATRAAHAQGLSVTSHFFFPGTMVQRLTGKEHVSAYYRDYTALYRDDLLTLARAAGTCVTPTLSYLAVDILHGRSALFPVDSTLWDDPATAQFIAADQLAGWRGKFHPSSFNQQRLQVRERWFHWDLENVRRLHTAGVRITTGTDYGNLPAVQLELELLVRAGLTPLEALRAATYDAASCLGVDDRLGSIEPGKLADFILVDGDPSMDIRALRNIHLVVLSGMPYTQADILGLYSSRH